MRFSPPLMGGNRKSLEADLFWDKNVCEAWTDEIAKAPSPKRLVLSMPPTPPHPPNGLGGTPESAANPAPAPLPPPPLCLPSSPHMTHSHVWLLMTTPSSCSCQEDANTIPRARTFPHPLKPGWQKAEALLTGL